MNTLEQNQALLDGFIDLLNDLLEDECDVSTVELILRRIEALLAVDEDRRPGVKGTQRVILADIKTLWEKARIEASDYIPAAIERIIYSATPRYGSGW